MTLVSKLYASSAAPTVLLSAFAGGLLTFLLRDNGVVDPLLLLPALALTVFFALRHGWQALAGNSLVAGLAFLLLHVLFAVDSFLPISIRPQLLILLLGTITALILLIRSFPYFWSFPFFRCLSVFFGINVIYYLLNYKTAFNLGAITAGYPVDFMTETSDTDAGTIVFLSSYVIFIAAVLGLAMFKEQATPEQIRRLLSRLAGIFAVSGALFFALIALRNFAMLVPAQGMLMGLFVMVLLSVLFWWVSSSPATTGNSGPGGFAGRFPGLQPSVLILLTLPLAAVCLLLGFNKTSLAGYALTLAIFFALNQVYVPGVDFGKTALTLLKSTEAKMLGLAAVLIVVLLVAGSGLLDMFSSKIDYFVNGFSSMSTMQIRTGNWHYFAIDWLDTLNLGKALFGYGLGQSRETIFFISAMRQAGDRTLVQTVHNNYMEYFYDYGLLGLVFYAATAFMLWDNVRRILHAGTGGTVKIFSILSLSCILYVGIYGLTDGVRVHVMMVYFAILAMIEGLKRACERAGPEFSRDRNGAAPV